MKRKKTGRPSSYLPAFAQAAERFARLGLIDEEMARQFGVSGSTFAEWKVRYPEFSEGIKRGKEFSDAIVVESLFRRAVGYNIIEETTVTDREGNVKTTKATRHIPPDTTAGIYWTKNKRPENWRDRHEVSGEFKGLSLVTILSSMPREKAARQAIEIEAPAAALENPVESAKGG